MKVQINGQEKELAGPLTVEELLKVENVKMPEMVSVEINGEILDREQFSEVIVKEDDEIEFLYFMGGGACGLY